MVVNMENSFKFPLKDKNWLTKILIGGALIWIPIVNFIVFGYLLKILKDAKENKEAVLPEWNDWGGLFQDGFMAFVVALCYCLVLVVLSIIGSIPLIGCLVVPIQIAAAILLVPVIVIALCFYLDKKDLSAAFNFKGIIEEFKKNIADYVVIAVIIGLLKMIACITLILAVFIWFYLSVVGIRMYGEVFNAGKSA